MKAIKLMVESTHYPKPQRDRPPMPAVGKHHAYCTCECCLRNPDNKHKPL